MTVSGTRTADRTMFVGERTFQNLSVAHEEKTVRHLKAISEQTSALISGFDSISLVQFDLKNQFILVE